MSSATEELRRLLDERGVKWRSKDEELGLNLDCFHDTRWHADRAFWDFTESGDNTCLTMCGEWNGCTPEQAIAATLGGDDRYDAGFASGIQAVFQQLEGIESYEELQDLIAEYWAEGEGNDER